MPLTVWEGGGETVCYLQLGEKKQKPSNSGMHKEVYWRRQHGGMVGEERLTLAVLHGAGSRQKGPLPASLLWATHRENLYLSEPWPRCQTPLFLQVIHTPWHLGHQVAGRLVLLPVLHLACPSEGEAAVRGTGVTSIPWGRAARDELQHHTPLGAGGELIQPSIRPRGGWMWPQSWRLRRFNARPCQMVQDQRFNLLPPSQLPHPSPSPGTHRVMGAFLPRRGGGRQCHHGKHSLSLLLL